MPLQPALSGVLASTSSDRPNLGPPDSWPAPLRLPPCPAVGLCQVPAFISVLTVLRGETVGRVRLGLSDPSGIVLCVVKEVLFGGGGKGKWKGMYLGRTGRMAELWFLLCSLIKN